MQIFCLMLAFSFRTSILHLFFMCLGNILNNSIWQNNFPGHKSQKFSPFFTLSIFFLSSKHNWFHWQYIPRMKIVIFKKLYVWIFILRKTTSEIQCKNEKDKYFAICQKDKFTFSSIKPLFPTRWLLIYWSPEALRPVRQKTLGTQIYSFTTQQIFYLISLLAALSHM